MNRSNIKRSDFKYNFLKQIIMRLDYEDALDSELDKAISPVKHYLKGHNFNRYSTRFDNEIEINIDASDKNMMQQRHDINRLKIYSFTDEEKGYTFDFSKKHICLTVNASQYSRFEDYSTLFREVVETFGSELDYFEKKRFGLRKINFCFLTDKSKLNHYFNPDYYHLDNIFPEASTKHSHYQEHFLLDNTKVNLLCAVEEGLLDTNIIYKITLDSDAYIDTKEDIDSTFENPSGLVLLNEIVFNIFVSILTDDFIALLQNDAELPQELIGVDLNE